ncbi:MAG: PAS domain-containing protein [Rhodobacteraceae bacterium]|nr:PAS domain-containing protein [Paracoccaceae bacterium]
MAKTFVSPTGREVHFDANEIIVSKTDPRGRMTYVNDVFMRVSGFQEVELIGEPHSMIRHPDMPRSVFKLLWDTIQSGQEIFAYVKNMCKSGDHYWVFAHVTPTFDTNRGIVGYHSNRRVPRRDALKKVEPLYEALLQEERRHSDRKQGLTHGVGKLQSVLTQRGIGYDEFVLSL